MNTELIFKGIAISETGLQYSYYLENLDNRDDARLKLITKVQRTYYYSCINEIGNHFDEIIYPTLKTKTSCKKEF